MIVGICLWVIVPICLVYWALSRRPVRRNGAKWVDRRGKKTNAVVTRIGGDGGPFSGG